MNQTGLKKEGDDERSNQEFVQKKKMFLFLFTLLKRMSFKEENTGTEQQHVAHGSLFFLSLSLSPSLAYRVHGLDVVVVFLHRFAALQVPLPQPVVAARCNERRVLRRVKSRLVGHLHEFFLLTRSTRRRRSRAKRHAVK
jgi:hypothetical protein